MPDTMLECFGQQELLQPARVAAPRFRLRRRFVPVRSEQAAHLRLRPASLFAQLLLGTADLTGNLLLDARHPHTLEVALLELERQLARIDAIRLHPAPRLLLDRRGGHYGHTHHLLLVVLRPAADPVAESARLVDNPDLVARIALHQRLQMPKFAW